MKMETELPKTLAESLNNIMKKEGYLTSEVTVLRINPSGTGYMGNLFIIDVKGKTKDGDKENNIFIKQILSNPEDMTIYSVTDVFKREALAYKELAEVFEEIQNEGNIGIDEKIAMAKCFDETNEKAIILENMTAKGYKHYHRMEVVPLRYAELSVENLAKFHALSLVFEKKKPEYFNQRFKTLKQPFIFGKHWDEFVNNMFKFSINHLEEEVKEKLEEKLLNTMRKYPEYMNDESGLQTLCHGDYKHNNIMVKEVNNVATKVLSIDYQLLHYGCPIYDLLYFIFNGTDQEFRREHMDLMKNLYYHKLKETVECFDVDLDTIMTREEFEKVFKDKLDFGLMINLFYVPFLFASENDIPDVTDSLADISFRVDPRFEVRLRGIVNDFVNWGYL